MALEAIRGESQHDEFEHLACAVPAAIAAIAAATQDESLLAESKPALQRLLAETESDVNDGFWLIDADQRQFALESLVAICLWQRDQQLTDSVQQALLAIDTKTRTWPSDWAKKQIERLGR